MDDIDRKISEILQADGRRPIAEIAGAVGLSTSAAHERIRRLTERGVLSVHALVDPEAAGLGLLVFTLVELDGPDRDEPFKTAMAAVPSVLECHHITGEWNYLLKIRARTTRELERLMSRRIKAVEGVRRTLTMVALSSAKETPALPLGLRSEESDA